MSQWRFPREAIHRAGGGVHFYINPFWGGKFVTDDTGAAVIEIMLETEDEEARIDRIARRLAINPFEAAARYVSFRDRLWRRRMLGGEREETNGAPRPNLGFLEVTRACLTRCRLCYVSSGEDRADNLTKEELFAAIDRMAEMGLEAVALSGGDPLARPDVMDLLEHIVARGMRAGISTSLLALGEETARRMQELGVLVQVSLDGSTPEINDWNRGTGSYEKAMRGVELLGRLRIPFRFACVVSKRNVEDLQGMVRLALDRGAREVAFAKVKLAGRAREEEGANPTREELAAAYYALYRKSFEAQEQGLAIKCKHNQPLTTGLEERVGRLPCGAGRTFVHVSYNGDIIPCSLLEGVEQFVLGNIRRDGLEEVWEHSPVLRFFRETTVEDIAVCAQCPVKYLCGGGCRGDAYLTTGDMRGPCSECGDLQFYYDWILARGLKRENVAVF